jgi:hypothetical protein
VYRVKHVVIIHDPDLQTWYAPLVKAPGAQKALEAAGDVYWNCVPVCALDVSDIEHMLGVVREGPPDIVCQDDEGSGEAQPDSARGGQQEFEKRARRDIEEEFCRVLDCQAPDTAVDHALSDLMEASAFQKGYSPDDVTLAVRRTLTAALDCLQTVLWAAKGS